MKLRFIAAATLIAVLSTIMAPTYAVTVDYAPISYAFSQTDTIEQVLEGTAVGTASWNEDLESFASIAGGTLTISSDRKAAFLSLSKVEDSTNFEMTADLAVSLSGSTTSSSYVTGFTFGAASDGYYQMAFGADKNVHLIKTSSLTTTSGTTLVSQSVADKMDYDGSSNAIKITLSDNTVKLFIDEDETLSYTNENGFKKGGFGFVVKRYMNAVYENFNLVTYQETYVYDEADYRITSFDAQVVGESAVLSWTNPLASGISGFTVKDSNGKNISYSGNVSTVSGAENSITITDITPGVDVGLRLVTSFTSHSDTTSETKIVKLPFSAVHYEITGFSAVSLIEAGRISWTNPVAGEIESITLTDASGTPYGSGFDLSAGAKNEITVSVAGGETAIFTLTVTFVGGETRTKVGSVTAVILEEAKYYPKNVLVYESYTKLGISWINPEKPLKSIKVVDAVTGEEAAFEDEISLTSEKANNALITDLDSKVDANFRIIFEFTDGHSATEYVAGGLPYGKGSYMDYEQATSTKLSGWDVFHNVATANYGQVPGYIAVERDNKVSGESAIRFVANYAKYYDNVFYSMRIKPFSAYVPGTRYLVRMKLNYKNAKDSVIFAYGNQQMNSYADGSTAPQLNVGTNLTPKASTNGWEEVSYIMEPTTKQGNPREAGLELKMTMLGTAESFIVDDLEMIPIDGDGNIIGDNILPNPELEASDNTPCGNVKLVSSESMLQDGTARIVWENPVDSTLKKVKVYRNIDGDLYECATLSNTATSVTIGNLQGNENAVFVIKTVDDADNVSSGVGITLTPKVSNLIVSDITFKSGNQNMTEIPTGFNGDVTASISVTNNGEDVFSGSLWVAVYDGAGILTQISYSETAVFSAGNGKKTLDAQVSVSSGYTAKAFFIDDIENMKLLADEAVLK